MDLKKMHAGNASFMVAAHSCNQSRWAQKIFLMHKIFARILNIWCVKTFSEHLITDLFILLSYSHLAADWQ